MKWHIVTGKGRLLETMTSWPAVRIMLPVYKSARYVVGESETGRIVEMLKLRSDR